jgi:hypothetical protein
MLINGQRCWMMMTSFVCFALVNGSVKYVAPVVNEKSIKAKRSDVEVKEVLYAFGVSPLTIESQRVEHQPEMVLFFEAPNMEVAERFVKSLLPEVEGQTLLAVTSKPFDITSIRSPDQ